ncbi:class I SAM-dependent methyltransferase [Sporolactobacillus sp. THM19-2]|jgi:ubiquinone/menaquinone biosynthesis C-methylase UbiE|uniref:class I SAM-dependent methyltransferase n=1 Tax=Sporolactobacillus sp. THM19-2 TaxID=2511171 RepID=UPI0010212E24|nr:class I SAM-dependent methyltransferase [Sporolactobacillus sp. THM19-2]RYL86841.1 class I SAM-dependent methyltransferase [Sporolactobacillus sp. THM19-2]
MEKVEKQYRNVANLNSRIQIHQKYSTNKKDWHEWLFEQYRIGPNSNVLELGCGDGTFWFKNKGRIPKSWTVTLSDFSSGMLADAQNKLGKAPNMSFRKIDIQDIPYEDDQFDAVIANHILYHVPDRQHAIQEIRRVLKPHGVFYASTVGEKHMMELNELLKNFDPSLSDVLTNVQARAFGLENGEEQLRAYFQHIQLKPFPGGLLIDDVQAIADYILSSGTEVRHVLAGEKLKDFIDYLEREKQKNNGWIHVTKATGLFESS